MRDTTPNLPPAAQGEAEVLAKKAVSDYLNACRMADTSNLGNYLLKLVSVASAVMAQSEGSDIAFERLKIAAEFVRKKMPKQPATLRPVQ